MNFSTEIKFLKGVGPVRAESFVKLGVDTVGALLRYYPRMYEDWSHIIPIREAPLQEPCCIKGIVSYTPSKVKIPGGTLLSKTSITDGQGILPLTFFNNKYISSMLQEGEEYLFFGKVTLNKYGAREMVSPMFAKAEGTNRIRPIYPQSAKLNSKTVERCVRTALDSCGEIPEFMPQAILDKNNLCPLNYAICNIHFPENHAALQQARRRLIFDELFTLQAGLLSMKDRAGGQRTSMAVNRLYTDEFYKLLPFTPTDAQQRAVSQALADMRSGAPMNRLLQGDVGSGKTAVAAALIYNAVKNNMQCAFMAPTEVLAEQHFRTFSALFRKTAVKAALLTGSTPPGEKKEIRSRLECGDMALVIGTHALIQDSVQFKRLGLVVTDEQHRFGVAQRAALASKGENPHLLVMSATPIPRTLGMILYGDLNVSVLDELPPGRQAIETYQVESKLHARVYRFIQKHLDRGLQAYIVCPLVEESEMDLIPAEAYYKSLRETAFRQYRLGLLHGKMKPKEKDAVMRAFAGGEIQLLISTIVIEVGVDVPNAAVMVIENAERFGLSQLHQLRGRVGRGKEKSTCILISDAQNEEAKQRFDILCKTTDGFEIADADLKMRGPGDFFGARQHGLPHLRIADILTDTELLLCAQNAAKALLEKDRALSLPENRGIKKQMDRLFGENNLNA